MIIVGSLLAWGVTYLVNLNNDLARARENEILNRDIMKRQAEEIAKSQKRHLEERAGAAYDRELELLIGKQRYEDALEYIEERSRLAFEQGNTDREHMYRRYRENLEFEMRDRSQDGF
ncbi:MAG: hypothetical protein R3F46_00625 [bacterium]